MGTRTHTHTQTRTHAENEHGQLDNVLYAVHCAFSISIFVFPFLFNFLAIYLQMNNIYGLFLNSNYVSKSCGSAGGLVSLCAGQLPFYTRTRTRSY